jgi:outer membrane protein OmpA-like peptidoglycan-associated protein
MRTKGLIVSLAVLVPVLLMIGCAHGPYPLPEFEQADQAIKAAEQLPPDQKDPAETEKAKAMVKEAYEMYNACRTDEARARLNEAIELANKRKPAPEAAAPAPPAPAPEPVAKFVTVSNEVLFDFDKSVLKPAAKTILDDIANQLMEDKEIKVLLEGHTCSIGTEAYNMGLSKRRAYAVYDYLVKKGIAEDRFTVKWYGESRPVADNKTKEGRARNRRTNITLSK